MQTITNNRRAAHTIFTKDGPVKVRPGATVEVNITAAEAREIEAAGLDVRRKASKAADDE